MNWINKVIKKNITTTNKLNTSNNLWTKCDDCNQILYKKELTKNLNVCPKCDHHMYISARLRLNTFLDKNKQVELGVDIIDKDIFGFKDKIKYQDRLLIAKKITKEHNALIVIKGTLYNMPVVSLSFEFKFIGGSMSVAVGEKFVMAVNQSLKDSCPLICFIASGGARIQEDILALMQMAKVSTAIYHLKKKCLPYITILTNPTMGGVSASLAMLGDINIAEPKALIGFTGSNIIEKTINKKLPNNFQKSEFLLEKGAIDLIIHRLDMRIRIARILAKLTHKIYPK
ncbi:MAG: acetyl-CoA carboxylase, carboxyltransferase subunit beta [Candidatus Lightella neohaematopini]|nr:acetyl-CoA carboxylase, carboxyltransferase subunit beta [Candidatus Lightella neohaematopini]